MSQRIRTRVESFAHRAGSTSSSNRLLRLRRGFGDKARKAVSGFFAGRPRLRKVGLLLYSIVRRIHFLPGIPLLLLISLTHLVNRDFRIAWISTDRIGHFVSDTCMSLGESNIASSRNVYFCRDPREPVSNDFWLEIFERNFKVINWLWVFVWSARLVAPHTPRWLLPPPRRTRQSQNLEGLSETPQFLKSENVRAKKWLESKGWREGEPIVCLMVRDDKYLMDWFSKRGRKFRDPTFFGYHNYRDTSITEYSLAAEWLAGEGCWVLRMGKNMRERLPSKRERVIDYAFDANRSDFLDIWLAANCTFAITTGNGMDELPRYWRRPLLAVNYLPMAWMPTWCETLLAPKPLFWTSGERLSLSEQAEALFFRSEDYVDAGIHVKSLNDEQVLQIVQEMWLRVQGMWHSDGDEFQTNDAFFRFLDSSLVPRAKGVTPSHMKNPKSLISRRWSEQLQSDCESIDQDWLGGVSLDRKSKK